MLLGLVLKCTYSSDAQDWTRKQPNLPNEKPVRRRPSPSEPIYILERRPVDAKTQDEIELGAEDEVVVEPQDEAER